MVGDWAAMKQAYALSKIADRLVGIDNTPGGVGRAIYEK
jgi:hypothetical protein